MMRTAVKAWVLFFVIWAQTPTAPAEESTEAPEVLPWALRNFYTFRIHNVELRYDKDHGTISMFSKSGEEYVSDMNFAVELAEGKTLTGADLERPESSREKFDGALGRGTHYSLVFPPKDGVGITHRLTEIKGSPFLLASLTVTNAGTAPVAVKALSPVIAGAKAIHGFGPQVSVEQKSYETENSPLPAQRFTAFYDEGGGRTLAVASLASGRAATTAELTQIAGVWQGKGSSAFEPPKELAPGESLESDPVWISFGLPNAKDFGLYYEHFLRTLPGASGAEPSTTSETDRKN